MKEIVRITEEQAREMLKLYELVFDGRGLDEWNLKVWKEHGYIKEKRDINKMEKWYREFLIREEKC